MVTEQPPSRYSISQDDFDPNVGGRLLIKVDGIEQRQVVEYDCGAGTVYRNVLDDNGKPQLNDQRDEVLRETVLGTVTVEWSDGR